MTGTNSIRGSALTEYGLLVVGIALTVLAVVFTFGDNTRAVFAASSNNLAGNEHTLPATKLAPPADNEGSQANPAATNKPDQAAIQAALQKALNDPNAQVHGDWQLPSNVHPDVAQHTIKTSTGVDNSKSGNPISPGTRPALAHQMGLSNTSYGFAPDNDLERLTKAYQRNLVQSGKISNDEGSQPPTDHGDQAAKPGWWVRINGAYINAVTSARQTPWGRPLIQVVDDTSYYSAAIVDSAAGTLSNLLRAPAALGRFTVRNELQLGDRTITFANHLVSASVLTTKVADAIDRVRSWHVKVNPAMQQVASDRQALSQASAQLLEQGSPAPIAKLMLRRPQAFFGALTSAMPQTVAYLYASPATAMNLMVAGGLGELEQDAREYEQREGKPLSQKDLLKLASRLPITVALEKIGLEKIKAGRWVGEIVTEELQNLVENFSVQRVTDPERSLSSGAIETGLAAVGAAGIGSQINRFRPNLRNINTSTSEKLFNGHSVGKDGRIYHPDTPWNKVNGVQPNNGAKVQARIYFVNGVKTVLAKQYMQMQHLANTGAEVIGIHNSTEGLVGDVGRATTDKMEVRASKPVKAVQALIKDHIRRGEPLHLAGHSHGALILSRALTELTTSTRWAKGIPPQEFMRRMGQITVETYGGAAWTFPAGPKYYHFVDKFDPIPMLLGQGATYGAARNRSDTDFHFFPTRPAQPGTTHTNMNDILRTMLHPHDISTYTAHLNRAAILGDPDFVYSPPAS